MTLATRALYEFGKYRLDPAEHLLLCNGKPVALTPKAFDILCVLAQNSGRLLSKDELMKKVWPNSFVEEANLSVNISALRRALRDTPDGQELIATVPKLGYRFVMPVKEIREAPPGESEPIETKSIGEGAQTQKTLSRVEATPVASSPTSNAKVAEHGGPNRWARAGILGVIALAVLIYMGYRLGGSRSIAPLSPRKIAILPFQNLNKDPNSDFLSFSLADAVIIKLGNISALSVRPSSAVQKYRDQVIDIPRVANELNVDTLLTGTFIREGNDLRVTTQLIDARNKASCGEIPSM